jgi:hypothetical protein
MDRTRWTFALAAVLALLAVGIGRWRQATVDEDRRLRDEHAAREHAARECRRRVEDTYLSRVNVTCPMRVDSVTRVARGGGPTWSLEECRAEAKQYLDEDLRGCNRIR